MLAVVKEPHIELSLGGRPDRVAEFLALVRSHYTVEILAGQTTAEGADGEEYENAFESDFWKGVTPGDLLAGTRLKHGLTQGQLAEMSGVHQVVISAYETGRRRLTRRAALKLAQAMGEEPDMFFRHLAGK